MAQLAVFLSHSTKDAAFVGRLEADLQAAGATVYRISADQGGDFLKRINDALRACEYVVLALTKDALASPWVEQEIHAAIGLKNQRRIKDILPIQAGPVDYRDIPPMWGVYNIFDATRDYASARDALLHALGLSAAVAPTAPAASPAVGVRPVSPAVPPVVTPAPPAISRERFPDRLARLGFEARKNGSVEYILPPVVTVPTGEFLMGSDPKRDSVAAKESWAKAEQPQHRLNLPTFQLAKCPLTVAEYACFVRSGHAEPKSQYNSLTWKQQLDGRLDHPVVNVSWNDVVAYANWLKQQTGQSWRLPTEAEWEKAARGTDGRIYPWGDVFDKGRCNTSEGGKGTTTPVGSYASGDSPYGALDMAGNVWEWTSSLFKSYPYTSIDDRENVNSTDNRVLRGGSWYNYSGGARGLPPPLPPRRRPRQRRRAPGAGGPQLITRGRREGPANEFAPEWPGGHEVRLRGLGTDIVGAATRQPANEFAPEWPGGHEVRPRRTGRDSGVVGGKR